MLKDFASEFVRVQRGKLAELIFFVTGRCNARCGHCFYACKMDELGKDLTLDEIKKISSKLPKFNALLISGGEPFLRIDLPEICETFVKNNKVGRIRIPTNGILVDLTLKKTEEILEKIGKAKLTMQLSIDGFKETHDMIRGVPGCFDKVMKVYGGLDELRRFYPNLILTLAITVSNKNIGELDAFLKWINETKKFDDVCMPILRGVPRSKDYRELTIEEARHALGLMIENNKALNRTRFSVWGKVIDKANARYAELCYRALESPYIEGFQCLAGKSIAVLEHDGNVKMCEMKQAIGNVKSVDYDLQKLLRRAPKGCACTHGCFMSPSVLYNPGEIIKAILK